tara:strand:- start:5423 stop:5692 length:270 start_codon:yes stop_codon:yes gene_type:complete
MTNKTVKKKSKSKNGLVKIDVIPMLKCKNLKYGCDVRAKKYTCYTHTKYKKNKRKADIITLTRRKKGTRKLKKPVLRITDWYVCPSYKK